MIMSEKIVLRQFFKMECFVYFRKTFPINFVRNHSAPTERKYSLLSNARIRNLVSINI